MSRHQAFATRLITLAADPSAAAYLSTATQNAAKELNDPEPLSEHTIQTVGVIGTGAMGRGIALAFANSSRNVILYDTQDTTVTSALNYITHYYQREFEKERINETGKEQRLSQFRSVDTLDGMHGCDMVVECVFEDLSLKQSILSQLARITPRHCILASNTSTLDIDKIASACSRPRQVIGTHFFIPAQITRLLEVVPGVETSQSVISQVMKLAIELKKVPVIAGNCDGFIGNRLFDRFHQEAMYLLEDGAYPEEVDKALEAWGMAIGPFRALDMVGNEIPWKVRKSRAENQPKLIQPHIGDQMCEAGFYGQKTGMGWYRYLPGQRSPQQHDEMHQLIEQCSDQLGITRRKLTPEEIVSRCLLALINEAAAIVDGGFAIRSSDIDVVYVNGYGFPAVRGGILYLAETLGLADVIHSMEHFKEHSNYSSSLWDAHPLLLSTQINKRRLTKLQR